MVKAWFGLIVIFPPESTVTDFATAVETFTTTFLPLGILTHLSAVGIVFKSQLFVTFHKVGDVVSSPVNTFFVRRIEEVKGVVFVQDVMDELTL